MAIICREHKLLFIMVPGTGCSVVGRVLRQELGGEWLPEQPLRRNGRTVLQRKHNTLVDIMDNGLLSEEERSDYLVFATVRNPFDRWVTYYQRYAGDWIDEYSGFAERQIERDRDRFELSEEEYERRLKSRDRDMQRHTKRRRIIRRIGFNNWMKASLLRWYWSGTKEGEVSPLEKYAFPMLDGVDVVMRQEQLEAGLNEILKIGGTGRSIELPRKNLTAGKKPYTEYWSHSTRWLAESLMGDEMKAFGYDFDGPFVEASVSWRTGHERHL